MDVVFTNPGGNPANPADLVDPTILPFSGNGETRGPLVPHNTPECTTQNPAYTFTVTSGSAYTHVAVSNPATGQFTITMDPNPSAARFAIVQVTDNCMGASQDFIFTQSCMIPAAPGAMTLSPASPIVITLNGTFTATVPNVAGMTYTWTLPAGLTGTSTTNSITITGAAGGSYLASAITVTATNACATSAARAGAGTICVGAALRTDIPASVDLAGSTWSTKNVDAPGTFTAHAGDPGMFYQWDSKIGWSSSYPLTSNPAGQTWSSTGSTAAAWNLTNNNPCPAGWSVPTDAQLTALNNVGSVYVDACTVAKLGLGTMAGQIFGTTTAPATYADFNPNTMLFLPATGYRSTNGALALTSVGTEGNYWGSVPAGPTYPGIGLGFNNAFSFMSNYTRTNGYSVRCVAP